MPPLALRQPLRGRPWFRESGVGSLLLVLASLAFPPVL